MIQIVLSMNLGLHAIFLCKLRLHSAQQHGLRAGLIYMHLFVLRNRPGAGHCLPQVGHRLQGERHLEGHHGARVHTEDVKHPAARCLTFVLSQTSHVSNWI